MARVKFPVGGIENPGESLSPTHFSQKRESIEGDNGSIRDYPSSIGNYNTLQKKQRAAAKAIRPKENAKDTFI